MCFQYILVWTGSWSRRYWYGWSDIRAENEAEHAAARCACWVVIPERRRRYLDTISYDLKDFTFGSGFEPRSNPEPHVRQGSVRRSLHYPNRTEVRFRVCKNCWRTGLNRTSATLLGMRNMKRLEAWNPMCCRAKSQEAQPLMNLECWSLGARKQ